MVWVDMSAFPHRVGCVRARSSVAPSPGSQRFSLTFMYEMHQLEDAHYRPEGVDRKPPSDRLGGPLPHETCDEMIDDSACGGACRPPHREIGVYGNAGQRPLWKQAHQSAILKLATACPAARRGDAET